MSNPTREGKPMEFARRYATRDPRTYLAYRLFRDGEEQALFREQAAAREALEVARIAHERAQERMAAADQQKRERRDWFAREVLRAAGQPEHDRSFEEAITYTSGGEVVVAVGPKAAR